MPRSAHEVDGAHLDALLAAADADERELLAVATPSGGALLGERVEGAGGRWPPRSPWGPCPPTCSRPPVCAAPPAPPRPRIAWSRFRAGRRFRRLRRSDRTEGKCWWSRTSGATPCRSPRCSP